MNNGLCKYRHEIKLFKIDEMYIRKKKVRMRIFNKRKRCLECIKQFIYVNSLIKLSRSFPQQQLNNVNRKILIHIHVLNRTSQEFGIITSKFHTTKFIHIFINFVNICLQKATRMKT